MLLFPLNFCPTHSSRSQYYKNIYASQRLYNMCPILNPSIFVFTLFSYTKIEFALLLGYNLFCRYYWSFLPFNFVTSVLLQHTRFCKHNNHNTRQFKGVTFTVGKKIFRREYISESTNLGKLQKLHAFCNVLYILMFCLFDMRPSVRPVCWRTEIFPEINHLIYTQIYVWLPSRASRHLHFCFPQVSCVLQVKIVKVWHLLIAWVQNFQAPGRRGH